jgi:hypothetical protein
MSRFRVTLHLDDDQIIDLLQGLLTTEERNEAFEHMRVCPTCEEFVRQEAADLERLRAAGVPVLPRADLPSAAVQSRLAGWVDDPADRSPLPLPLRTTRRPRWAAWLGVGAAAAAAIVVLARVSPLTHRGRPLPEVGWLPVAGDLSILRSGSVDANLVDGLAAYDRHDLPRAIALLRHPQSDSPYEPYERLRRVYLGCALAASGEHAEAVSVIKSVPYLENMPEPWSQELQWAFHVSLAATGDRRGADSLLRVLAAEPGPVGERARHLR